MNIREFKQKAIKTLGHVDETITANNLYFELFYYDVLTIIGSGYFIHDGFIVDSYGQRRDFVRYIVYGKQVNKNKFKNIIKNL